MRNVLEVLFGDDASVVLDTDFQLLIAANVMGVLGVALVSPLLNTLTGAFGVSHAEVGLLISMFTAPPIVVIPLAGMLADTYGRKPIMLMGLVLFGSAGLAIAFTTDFRTVLALRFLQGVGFAGTVPIIITSIGDLYVESREATAQGLRFTTSGLSMTLFPLLAAGIVVFAWQYPFFLFGLSIPIALLLYLVFNEPAQANTPGESRSAPADPGVRTLLRLVTHRRVAAIVLARALPNIIWTAFLTYNSIVVVQLLSASPMQAGLLVAIASSSFALSASQAGRITTAFDSRLFPLIGANLSLAFAPVLVAFAPLVPVAAVGAAGIGLGFGVTMSIYRSIITNYAPGPLRGGLVSLAESLGRVTSTATPIVMGVAIALGAQTMGFNTMVQWTVSVICLFAGMFGVVCVIITSRAPPIPDLG